MVIRFPKWALPFFGIASQPARHNSCLSFGSDGHDRPQPWQRGLQNCLRFARPAEAAIAKVFAKIFQKTMILQIFEIFRHVGELEICLVSKFQLCTTLGGRKNAEKPKYEFSEFSVRSVRYSIRFDRYCVRGSWWTALVSKRLCPPLMTSTFDV